LLQLVSSSFYHQGRYIMLLIIYFGSLTMFDRTRLVLSLCSLFLLTCFVSPTSFLRNNSYYPVVSYILPEMCSRLAIWAPGELKTFTFVFTEFVREARGTPPSWFCRIFGLDCVALNGHLSAFLYSRTIEKSNRASPETSRKNPCIFAKLQVSTRRFLVFCFSCSVLNRRFSRRLPPDVARAQLSGSFCSWWRLRQSHWLLTFDACLSVALLRHAAVSVRRKRSR